jgi:hypothetical protein
MLKKVIRRGESPSFYTVGIKADFFIFVPIISAIASAGVN